MVFVELHYPTTSQSTNNEQIKYTYLVLSWYDSIRVDFKAVLVSCQLNLHMKQGQFPSLISARIWCGRELNSTQQRRSFTRQVKFSLAHPAVLCFSFNDSRHELKSSEAESAFVTFFSTLFFSLLLYMMLLHFFHLHLRLDMLERLVTI